jgi:hypothetical protein
MRDHSGKFLVDLDIGVAVYIMSKCIHTTHIYNNTNVDIHTPTMVCLHHIWYINMIFSHS